ncbi:unnamed protein product, partial [Pleuronectes platessa]
FQQFLLIAFLLPIPACLTVYVSAFSLPDTLPCDRLPSRVPTLDWNDYQLCRCLSPVGLLYPCLDCQIKAQIHGFVPQPRTNHLTLGSTDAQCEFRGGVVQQTEAGCNLFLFTAH